MVQSNSGKLYKLVDPKRYGHFSPFFLLILVTTESCRFIKPHFKAVDLKAAAKVQVVILKASAHLFHCNGPSRQLRLFPRSQWLMSRY